MTAGPGKGQWPGPGVVHPGHWSPVRSSGPAPSAPAGKVEPYIPASKSLPELTAGVLILGILRSVILGGANAYLGMFA